MWQVLPTFSLIKLISYLFVLLFLIVIIFVLGNGFSMTINNSNFIEVVKLAGIVTVAVFAIVLAMAKWGWLLFWRAPVFEKILNTKVCPDLNGTWQGSVKPTKRRWGCHKSTG